jgi:uncharacterized protein (DUF2235 family)
VGARTTLDRPLKRLAICCDGTWGTPDQFDETHTPVPTNVTKLAQCVADRGQDSVEQRMFYTPGVGTSAFDHLRGGVFGVGLSQKIKDAYMFIVETFAVDDELFLFGFSRGAYTARSLAGLIRNSGVLRPQYASRLDEAYELYRDRSDATHPRSTQARLFRATYSYEPRIKFIGVWDTVGSLGIPDLRVPVPTQISDRWKFHDVELSTTVDFAYHALGLDEKRKPFEPTLWDQQDNAPATQVLEQMWFAGTHGNVGGGWSEVGLSDLALLWLVTKARACGLNIDLNVLDRKLAPNQEGALQNSMTWYYSPLGDGTRYLPAQRLRRDPKPGQNKYMRTNERVASTAKFRFEHVPGYQPKPLSDYLASGRPVCDVPLTDEPPQPPTA